MQMWISSIELDYTIHFTSEKCQNHEYRNPLEYGLQTENVIKDFKKC